MLTEASASVLTVYKTTCFLFMNVSNYNQRAKPVFSVCFEMELMCCSAAK